MTVLNSQSLKVWHLLQCPIFSKVTPKEAGALLHHMHVVGFGPGDDIPLSKGGDAPSLWIVKRGHVKLTYLDDHQREATVMILSPGDVFGSLVTQPNQPYDGQCEALTSACLCRIDNERFQNMMARYPDVAYELTKANFNQIHKLQTRLSQLMTRSVESRLALVLLELNDQLGEDTEDGTGRRLSLPISHMDLAHLIGSSREMVTHVMRRFREAGWIESARRKITLLDVESLRGASDK
jgi:CRP-like cAMP-binding protein